MRVAETDHRSVVRTAARLSAPHQDNDAAEPVKGVSTSSERGPGDILTAHGRAIDRVVVASPRSVGVVLVPDEVHQRGEAPLEVSPPDDGDGFVEDAQGRPRGWGWCSGSPRDPRCLRTRSVGVPGLPVHRSHPRSVAPARRADIGQMTEKLRPGRRTRARSPTHPASAHAVASTGPRSGPGRTTCRGRSRLRP